MARSPFRATALAAGLTALAGCGPPVDAPFVVSPQAEAAPAPSLVATARFEGALAEAGGETEEIAGDSAALAARAEALRARARALQAPILSPEDRGRLDAAAAARAPG